MAQPQIDLRALDQFAVKFRRVVRTTTEKKKRVKLRGDFAKALKDLGVSRNERRRLDRSLRVPPKSFHT